MFGFILTILFIISISIFIYYNNKETKILKNKINNIEVGQKYYKSIIYDDPFEDEIILKCEIIDIKYDMNYIKWVKYQFDDKSIGTDKAEIFIQSGFKLII